MTSAILRGNPDAGNPHVRFDEGEAASVKPRRGSLLYTGKIKLMAVAVGLIVPAVHGSELEPLAMKPLPIGAVMPEGWLKVQLDQMSDGLCGHLYEHSSFLKPGNGWLNAAGVGWEEQPYWFRGFVKTAILTGNDRMLKVSKDWVEKILATRDTDGWYGPQMLKAHKCTTGKVISDIWGHMVMNEALLSWYEYTGDKRILDLLLAFYRCLSQMDDVQLIPSAADQVGCGGWQWSIQVNRAGDALPAIYACYDRTLEPWLLDLAARVWRHRERPRLFMDNHNVNFAQLFGYGTVMSRLTHSSADRASAAFWFDLHMKAWSNSPRWCFAADEVVRNGCTDPRYGTETCTWAEFIRSFGLVGSVTGDTAWGDRTEDVMFNWYPISYTPGWKELHYITAGNQVNLDAHTDHNYANGPPMVAYSADAYRCCRHNAHFGLPHFCESLVMKSGFGALAFWLYAPHRGYAEIGGKTASWRLETQYPFRETARLTVNGDVPLRFRVPGWCKKFEVRDGGLILASAEKGGWVDVARVRDGATLEIDMRAETAWCHYPRNGGVSLERGPLTYSLALEPVTRRVRRPSFAWDREKAYLEAKDDTSKQNPDFMTEVVCAQGVKWNYAIDVRKTPRYSPLEFNPDCFRFTAAPSQIVVVGHRLAEWGLQDNQPAELQDSPAYTTAPAEELRFIPLCCARLHMTVFPTASADKARANQWHGVPGHTSRKDRQKTLPK